MNKRNVVYSLVITAVVMLACFQMTDAKPAKNSGKTKIGVVDIRNVFENSKKNDSYRKSADAEQQQIIAELDKMNKEIELAQAGLNTLKPGTKDYEDEAKAVIEKQANLQANQEFYKQTLSRKDQKWTEDVYNEILRLTAEVAQQKGLDLVLEKNVPMSPAMNANELMLNIRTHKVLYSDGCEDITNEVMARLDAAK